VERHLEQGTSSSSQSFGNLCLVAGASLMLAAVLYIWAFVAQTVLPAPSSDAAAVTLSFIAQYSSVFTLS